jgi:Sugar-transfer associated ATP-grasp
VPFAELKMPRLGNITDNILDGKRGNIVCPVVMESGQTEAAWAIVDPKLRYCQQRLSHHPETNNCFTDFVIPHWAEAIDLAKRTAKIYPASPMLGLDIAITKDGCAVLDVNNQTSTPWVAGDHGMRPYLADFFPDVFGVSAPPQPLP